MKLKFVLLYILVTFLLLFYPGDSMLFNIFAFQRDLFTEGTANTALTINSVPLVKNQIMPYTSAEGMYIVDKTSYTPLFTKNPHERLLPASTTKILTALVAYDVYKPDDIITIQHEMNEGQVMELKPGERITVENLLYGMLIYSGNDAAYALAEHYGIEKYMKLVNQKAQDLGMKQSQFKNPAGLDAVGQYTTPFDLALAARELLKNKYLSKIVSIKEITISDVDFKYFHQLANVNKLLGELQGIGGLKTGYTENAGENLVSFYRYNGHDYIIVILKSLDRFEDTRTAVKWIQDNINYESVNIPK